MTTSDPAFVARVDQWIAWEWDCVGRDRSALLLVAAMADAINDEGGEDGPAWTFHIDREEFSWNADDGWDCMEADRLLAFAGARWLAGTLPVVPTLTPNGPPDAGEDGQP